ncbi:uncharacterized protein EV420DRAFT_702406 [Desarmillaria tabescens]|uniref:Protein kinase domain-containing protein n=1 Tax=Armillaria tabescens TaxID=1929756 RepID=A0AA39JZX0_ARMTA|nr:uncharacterized protein EV420DRAFT_702406 [Desarmillaria tabescens]KAK0452001.1 hypothetical protein EV420DRAFT_702406 [Desarmillaria tabescens]
MSDSLESRSESLDDIEALEELLSFVPPPLRQDPDSDVPASDWSPVTFFDKHLDDSLILKRVKVLPRLVSTLSEALDEHVSSFKSRGKPFYSPYILVRHVPYNNTVVATASDISRRFCEGGHPFIQAASVLALHPHQSELKSVFVMSGRPADEPPDFHSEQYTLQHTIETGTLMSALLGSLDDDRKALLLSVLKSFPRLAIYEAYALSGKIVLEEMSGLSTYDVFPWKKGGGSRYRQVSHQVPPPDSDASKYLWETEPSDHSMQMEAPSRLRRSERLKKSAVDTSTSHKKPERRPISKPSHKAAATTQSIIAPKKTASHRYTANAADFIQRAWAHAVDCDSTVIIFDCGNYLRVGIRHRKTQTLYLSDLVDVCSHTDPAYGKLLVGIYLAIIRDAMDRAPLLDKSLTKTDKHSTRMTSRKRRRDRDEVTPVRRSRRKLGESSEEVEPDVILSELSTRNVALLYLEDGRFNSPLPSFFRRAGSSSRKRSFRYDECLALVLLKKIGEGAVGEAYEASLEVDLSAGNVARHPHKVIVKLAFHEEQTERLRHEYSIYRYLSTGPNQVKNIPRAFGFFEDVESEAGVLILSHAGVALAYRSTPPGTGIEVSDEERATFIQILKSIHAAGVAHGDIRSWNLLEDDKGGLFIADFDRAKIHGSRRQMAAELERIGNLLDGENIDDNSVTSYPASS